MHSEASERSDRPAVCDELADLQAGLLDDATAAALRRRVRTDPAVARQLEALDRVRRDIAALGVDADSARDVPAEITERIGAALRDAPPRPGLGLRRAALAAGIAAAIAAAAVGTTVLLRHESADVPPAEASRPSGGVPLTDEQILALLQSPPDLGALAEAQRRASCLGGLGYPTSTSPLGARPLTVSGRPGVLLLLPGDAPGRVDAVVVAPNCSSVDTGLLARTVVTRP